MAFEEVGKLSRRLIVDGSDVFISSAVVSSSTMVMVVQKDAQKFRNNNLYSGSWCGPPVCASRLRESASWDSTTSTRINRQILLTLAFISGSAV